MESLPATTPVRRTVRVAVALLVSQALLCGLIGWLTLGHAGDSGSTVDQMAAPPAVPPTTTTRRFVAPTPPSLPPPTTTTTRSTTDRKPVTHTTPSRRPASPKPATPTPTPSPSTVLPAPPVPTIVDLPSPPGRALVPEMPPPPSPSVVPGPVQVGARCTPVGAYARTAGGTLVRCVRVWRHRARWKIV